MALAFGAKQHPLQVGQFLLEKHLMHQSLVQPGLKSFIILPELIELQAGDLNVIRFLLFVLHTRRYK